MTLPAERERGFPSYEGENSKPHITLAGRNTRASGPSPVSRLLSMLDEAHSQAGLAAEITRQTAQSRREPIRRRNRFGRSLAVWSFGAALIGLGCLALETFQPPARPAPIVPALDFSQVSTRFVQSSEGPALELTGIVRNISEEERSPEVLVQLAGSRVAIEEPLWLGGSSLLPGAERPFAVRMLLPQGTKTVRLLPQDRETSLVSRDAPLVSPAWTAEQPEL